LGQSLVRTRALSHPGPHPHNRTMLLTLALALQVPVPRDVVAPPEDILAGVVRLPSPEAGASVSRAAIESLHFRRGSAGWEAALEVQPGSHGTLALLSPAAARWKVLAAPAGLPLRHLDERTASLPQLELAGDFLPGFVLARRELRAVAGTGWNVRVVAARPEDLDRGWALVTDGHDVRARGWLDAHGALRGEPAAIVARLEGEPGVAVREAWLELDAGEASERIAMRDDGAHGDAQADDGLFGAWLPPTLVGEVVARAQLFGTTRRGERLQRTVPLAFVVHEPALALEGNATATALDGEPIELAFGAHLLDTPRRLHVSAEVWGTVEGELAPVCWVSRMLDPEVRGRAATLRLRFDARWLELAGASGSLELRHVRVQDPDTCGVLAFSSHMDVDASRVVARAASATLASSSALLAQNTIPVGPRPAFNSERPIQPGLVLAHGYCSTGSIWPSAHFTQPKYVFLDPSANRSHDQFAQLIGSRADLAGYSSFGIVAHSQGGCAALQLLTYYTSGLDHATGGRRIQSLATPYQGTPLASLGFFTCGTNSNLTPSGASTWLAGIPTWARAEVSYWTTANSGSACNALAAILLADPEDGTVERTRGQLTGANSMGHVAGWCHTTGMSQPAGYLDASRNTQMNAAAAR